MVFEELTKMEWDYFVEKLSFMLLALRFGDEIKNMKLENELMSHLMSNEEILKYISIWLKNCYDTKKEDKRKNIEYAKLYKSTGNNEFKLKNYTKSLHLYTKSALYAPSDSLDLPLAIANRSASLFYLNRWQDCIEDIELAIKLGYPEILRPKLNVRIARCYINLGKKRLATEAIHRIHNMITDHDTSSEKKEEQLQQQIKEISSKILCMKDNVDDVNTTESPSRPEVAFGENPDFPFASAAIDIKHTPEKGRYVVANRNIKKGQILFVEEAFAFVPLHNGNIDHVCQNCCRLYGDTPVPCTECMDAIFCKMNCWEEARSSYHRWECLGSQMGLWQQIGIANLALKMLFTCVTTTDNNRFNEVQQLVTNFDKLLPCDIILYGLTAAMITLYLSKYTDFFKVTNFKTCLASKFSNNNLNISGDLDERVYVSSLLLRHILQLVANGHAITKISVIADKNKQNLYIERQDRIATAIYPSASMLNHSCDPNIINSFMGRVLIVKAMQNINAGEEITHCYGTHFRRMLTPERQEKLKSQYCFKCDCEPCTMPEYEHFMKKFTALKCPQCSGPLCDISSSYSCLDCGVIVSEFSYIFILKQARTFFNDAENYIKIGRYEEALVKLKECLSLRRDILYKYHVDITATLDLIAQVYVHMEQWLSAIWYLEHSIVTIRERYGSASIEVCNEINKLTDICFKYLQNEYNTSTKFYKNVLKKTRRYLDEAQEIVDLIYGPWTEVYCEITEKKKMLSSILQNFNV